MRITPKISDKPAERRNRRPPKATALTDSTYQFIGAVFPARGRGERRALSSRQRPLRCCVPLRLERRVVARIDRLCQELLLVVSPELADVVIGLHGLVPEL